MTQDFNEAYASIVSSESAYSAASSHLEEAVGGVSARLRGVAATLGEYEAETADLRPSELKMAADALYAAINESLLIGRAAIDSALPVSCETNVT